MLSRYVTNTIGSLMWKLLTIITVLFYRVFSTVCSNRHESAFTRSRRDRGSQGRHHFRGSQIYRRRAIAWYTRDQTVALARGRRGGGHEGLSSLSSRSRAAGGERYRWRGREHQMRTGGTAEGERHAESDCCSAR